jgi:hypothetical protein
MSNEFLPELRQALHFIPELKSALGPAYEKARNKYLSRQSEQLHQHHTQADEILDHLETLNPRNTIPVGEMKNDVQQPLVETLESKRRKVGRPRKIQPVRHVETDEMVQQINPTVN